MASGQPSESVKVTVTQCARLIAMPWTVAHQVPCPWNFPGKNTRVGSHSLFQRVFPTQGSNPGLLYCRQTLSHLSQYPLGSMNSKLRSSWCYFTYSCFTLFSFCFSAVFGSWVSNDNKGASSIQNRHFLSMREEELGKSAEDGSKMEAVPLATLGKIVLTVRWAQLHGVAPLTQTTST